MSWTTVFKTTKGGTRSITYSFSGFATIYCTSRETILYKNGERVVRFDGDIKISSLERLQQQVEADFLKLKEFNHEPTN